MGFPINTLLIISLFFTQTLCLDFPSEQTSLHNIHSYTYVIDDKQQSGKKSTLSDEIDEEFLYLDANRINMMALLEEKNNVLVEMQKIMRTKAASKTSMSEEQIAAFKEFNELYTK